ncbi:MAG: cytochrome c class [Flavipsychrobacter sp.]|jgi:hypothetical protein|nr:cytochrome c class [Flavipsychrobacter sp.]
MLPGYISGQHSVFNKIVSLYTYFCCEQLINNYKYILVKKIAVILSVLFVACSPKTFKFTEADATRGANKFPGLTVEELKRGKAVHDEKCTVCHGAKRPSDYTEEQWRKIVPAMATKAQESGTKPITGTDQDMILKYVITMGAK